MNLNDLTVIVITYDEIANIERLLDDLRGFPKVLLVDSGSRDGTLECARQFANVRIMERAFDSFASQCNAALDTVDTAYVMSLDADYRISADLRTEIEALEASAPAYWCRFVFAVHGQPLRVTLLPPRAILFRAGHRYLQDGHAHRLVTDATPRAMLKHAVTHDDRKALPRWCAAQIRYAAQEADKLLQEPDLSWPDRIRRWLVVAPWLVPLYALLVRGLIFDGRAGVHYALQRAIAECLLSLFLIDRFLRGKLRP